MREWMNLDGSRSFTDDELAGTSVLLLRNVEGSWFDDLSPGARGDFTSSKTEDCNLTRVCEHVAESLDPGPTSTAEGPWGSTKKMRKTEMLQPTLQEWFART